MKTWLRRSSLTCVFLATTSIALSQTPTSQRTTSQPRELDLIDRLLALPSPVPDWREQRRKRNAALPSERRDWFEGEPSEDADADVLLAYWGGHSSDEKIRSTDLSDKLRRRLLEAAEQGPAHLGSVLRFLPDTPDAAARVARIYEAAKKSGKPDNPVWREDVLIWLGEHNEHYRADLIALARSAEDRESWIEHREAVRALARGDWEAARPVLLTHADGKQSGVAGLSMALLYKHAVATGSQDEAASWREKLKSLVESRAARDLGRAIACETLMASEWEGRDDWFLSLFADPSLREIDSLYDEPPPLRAVVRNDPDYWIPRVAVLIGDRNRAVHDAAVHCLIQFGLKAARADALRPLLPWLSDPQWADDGPDKGRLRLIQSLDLVSLPQSVPGLIHVVEYNVGFKLSGAAEALAFHKAKEAIPLLKDALGREPQEYQRKLLVRTLLTMQAFTDDELLDAVEAYAAATSTEADEAHFKLALNDYDPPFRLEVKLSLGYWVDLWADSQNGLSDEVARKFVNRVNEPGKKNAPHADRLWSIISRWEARPVDAEILRRLASGQGDESSIAVALRRRESLRAHVPDQLAALCNQSGMPSGVALVLLGDAHRYPAILEGSDPDAQRALLACARLAPEPLPVPLVAQLAKSKDERVAAAAWLYLESEDSPAARQVVLTRYPGQAKILGAYEGFFNDREEDLRKAILADDGPDEVYALLSTGDSPELAVCIRGDKVELRVYRKPPAYTSQTLSRKHWRGMKSFLTANSVDDLAPCDLLVYHGVEYEYLHVTKDGGRRVYMNTPQFEPGSLYDRLVRRFERLEVGGRDAGDE